MGAGSVGPGNHVHTGREKTTTTLISNHRMGNTKTPYTQTFLGQINQRGCSIDLSDATPRMNWIPSFWGQHQKLRNFLCQPSAVPLWKAPTGSGSSCGKLPCQKRWCSLHCSCDSVHGQPLGLPSRRSAPAERPGKARKQKKAVAYIRTLMPAPHEDWIKSKWGRLKWGYLDPVHWLLHGRDKTKKR